MKHSSELPTSRRLSILLNALGVGFLGAFSIWKIFIIAGLTFATPGGWFLIIAGGFIVAAATVAIYHDNPIKSRFDIIINAISIDLIICALIFLTLCALFPTPFSLIVAGLILAISLTAYFHQEYFAIKQLPTFDKYSNETEQVRNGNEQDYANLLKFLRFFYSEQVTQQILNVAKEEGLLKAVLIIIGVTLLGSGSSIYKGFVYGFGALALASLVFSNPLILIILAVSVGVIVYLSQKTKLIPSAEEIFLLVEWEFAAPKERTWWFYTVQVPMLIAHALGEAAPTFAIMVMLCGGLTVFTGLTAGLGAVIIGISTGWYYGVAYVNVKNNKTRNPEESVPATVTQQNNWQNFIQIVSDPIGIVKCFVGFIGAIVLAPIFLYQNQQKELAQDNYLSVRGGVVLFFGSFMAVTKGALGFVGTVVTGILILTGSTALVITPPGWLLAIAIIIAIATTIVQASRLFSSCERAFKVEWQDAAVAYHQVDSQEQEAERRASVTVMPSNSAVSQPTVGTKPNTQPSAGASKTKIAPSGVNQLSSTAVMQCTFLKEASQVLQPSQLVVLSKEQSSTDESEPLKSASQQLVETISAKTKCLAKQLKPFYSTQPDSTAPALEKSTLTVPSVSNVAAAAA